MKFSGRTVTAIIEFLNDKILLVKRGTAVFKGYWALPGGRVETGETVEQAVMREVKEETGLNIEILCKIGEYHENGVQEGIEYDYFPACFLVKPTEGKIKRQVEEIEKIELFNLKDIPTKLAFEHATMIKDYVRIRKIRKIDEKIRKCRKCRLYKTRTCAVPGEGPANARIMICGQAPGRIEDMEGRPFVGIAGKFLNEILESIKLDRKKIFITSPIKCFPPSNRLPKSDELKACRPYLDDQIRIIKPKVIIALGNCACQTLLEKGSTISKLHGQLQEKNGIIIFPTFHPAAAMRFPKIKALIKEDFKGLLDLLTKIGLA
jgi:DNA polymerase